MVIKTSAADESDNPRVKTHWHAQINNGVKAPKTVSHSRPFGEYLEWLGRSLKGTEHTVSRMNELQEENWVARHMWSLCVRQSQKGEQLYACIRVFTVLNTRISVHLMSFRRCNAYPCGRDSGPVSSSIVDRSSKTLCMIAVRRQLEHSQYGGSDLQKGLVCRVRDRIWGQIWAGWTARMFFMSTVQYKHRQECRNCCNDGGHHTHRNTQVVVNHIANHVCFILD